MEHLEETTWTWIAGLLEGEGCFGMTNNYPVLYIQMTDKDVMEKLSTFLEANLNGPYKPKYENSKPTYQIALRKTKKLEFIVDKIYNHMGERRKKSIDVWREYWHDKYLQKLRNADISD